ncbi:tetratricopeptide repeat protein 24-like [Acipenser ruthenus]|uniref:tetratricopeptide repeat protein 24-like n=1 Tax=Acipenser ruthenus TaxID=7906 RepID=UPI002740CD9F|nr:tetratricopeptide repeat protein 24-like [Acipenser ruthenus]
MASKVTMNSSGETEAAAILADIEKLTKSGSQVLADDHHERALSIFKKAYLLSLKLPEGQTQKACLFNLGAAYIAVGKAKKGLKCLMKCKLKEPEGRDADMYFNIGIAYEEMKEYSKAVKFYQKAVNDYGAHQADNTADALIKLAYCSVNLKDPASAAHSFRLAGQSYQQAGRWDYAAMALRECASYMIQSQRFSKAGVQQVLKECHQICKGISHSSLKGKLLNDIGLHYTELKSFNQAKECFTEALGSCSGMSFSIRKRAVLLQNTGAIHNAMNQYETSLKYHAEAADMYGALEERKAQGESLCNLAYAYSQMKNYKTASLYYQEALQAFKDVGDLHGQWQMCEGLGATQFCLGNMDQAISYYKQALAVFGQSKEKSEVPRERILGKLTDTIKYNVALQQSHSRKQSFPLPNETLTATTPALTQEGEDEHTLSSKACAVSRPLFFTLRTHHAATQELQHRRTTQLSGSLQASPQAPGQTTGAAGAW